MSDDECDSVTLFPFPVVACELTVASDGDDEDGESPLHDLELQLSEWSAFDDDDAVSVADGNETSAPAEPGRVMLSDEPLVAPLPDCDTTVTIGLTRIRVCGPSRDEPLTDPDPLIPLNSDTNEETPYIDELEGSAVVTTSPETLPPLPP